MKKYITVGGIILLFTLLNISTFLVGLAKTPPGMVFTGAVHYPPDYFYYLSFIAQGATRWFSNYLLYNADTTIPQLIGSFYTFSGHLLLPLFRSQIYVFQVLTVLGSIWYLVASYILIKKLIPHNRSLQTIVFLFFLTSSTMPQIAFGNGHLTYSYVYSWYNFGDPFERLTNIPSHLFNTAGTISALILSFGWWKTFTKPGRFILLSAILGLLISGIQPATWLVVTIALGVVGLTARKNKIVPALLPALVVGASGLPFVLYYKLFLNTIPPYNSAFVWEPLMRINMTLRDYLVLNGPLVVTGILGLPLWFRAITRERFTLTFITALSLLLFFSRIPDSLGILNVRFLSVFPSLFWASVTGFAIGSLFTKFPASRMILAVLVALLIGLSVPLFIQELTARNYLFVPNNSWDYLSADAYHAFEVAAKISRPDDIFLIFPPFDAAFPGLTGRRIYTSYSNTLMKFNFEKKQKPIDVLYSDATTEEQKIAALKQSRISYIINYTWITPPVGGLVPVYRNNLMTIYRVPVLQ